jgi:hypothetical protein
MRSRVTGAVLAVILAAGCTPSPPPRVAKVFGRVTYKGQPIPGGQVSMKALGENPQVEFACALLLPDGRYILTEAPTGPVKVTVDTETVKSPIAGNDGGSASYVEIPKRYSNFATSGLTLEVRPEDQEFNIELVP